MDTKRCSMCNEEKDVSDFPIDYRYKEEKRYLAACKQCRKKYYNPEMNKVYDERYKLKIGKDNYKKQVNEYMHGYRDKNRDKINAYNREYRKQGYVKERIRKYNANKPKIVKPKIKRVKTIQIIDRKVCNICGKEKMLSEFHIGAGKGGRKAQCAECYNWKHRPEEFKKIELEKRDFEKRGVRRCPECKEVKPLSEFAPALNRSIKVRSYCRPCERKLNLIKSRLPNIKQKQDEYELSPQYFANNKRRYEKKIKENPDYKTALYLRNRMNSSINEVDATKLASYDELIGCTPTELRSHLESQFTEGMSWDNHEHKGWHTDHILPIKAFNMHDNFEQHACFNWRNLRPMWGRANIQKSAKYNQSDFDAYLEMFKTIYQK